MAGIDGDEIRGTTGSGRTVPLRDPSSNARRSWPLSTPDWEPVLIDATRQLQNMGAQIETVFCGQAGTSIAGRARTTIDDRPQLVTWTLLYVLEGQAAQTLRLTVSSIPEGESIGEPRRPTVYGTCSPSLAGLIEPGSI